MLTAFEKQGSGIIGCNIFPFPIYWHLQSYLLEFHNLSRIFNFFLSILFLKMYQCVGLGWTVWKVTIDCQKSEEIDINILVNKQYYRFVKETIIRFHNTLARRNFPHCLFL